jgi:hypothetical protein
MKTKNNVQKTAFKSVVAATGLAIIGLTVNAQYSLNSMFETNSSSHIAMVAAKTTDNSFTKALNTSSLFKTSSMAAYLVAESEEPLHLEEWMLDDDNFSTFQIETETENPLELENWMTEESNFDANLFNFDIEKEEELNLEDWMLNENKFDVIENKTGSVETKKGSKTISTATYVYVEVNEERALKLEGWMINPNIWGR